jgi:hypothetical protein
MKRSIFLLLLPVCLLLSRSSMAQQPFLTIYYYYGEKSRDSHSNTENISINGSSVLYSIKYSGRKGPAQKDEEKTCTLTSEQLEKINKTIKEKHLDVTDSVIINNDKQNPTFEGGQISSTIIITLTRAGTTTITKCKGVPGDFDDKPLYKNSLYLLRTIKAMLKLCQ